MTAAEYQQLIVDEFALEEISTNIARYWTLSDQGDGDARTYLRTRLYVIDLLLTRAANRVSFRALDGASVSLSDWFDHLTAIRQAAYQALQEARAAQGVAASGQLTTTAPVAPPPGMPDANDPAYGGWPYARRRRT